METQLKSEPRPKQKPRVRLELPLLAGLALFGLVFLASCRPESDPDIWWHLAAGKWMAQHHQVPHADPFSYTMPNTPWVAHEWLTEVVFYALYRHFGVAGLALYKQLAACAGALLLYVLCLRCGVYPLVAFVAGAAYMAIMAPTFNARPQILLPVFVLLLLHMIVSHRRADPATGRGRWALWWAVPLTVLWANMHGGFIMLFMVLAMYAVDRVLVAPERGLRGGRWRLAPRRALPVIAVMAVAALATLINPNGLHGALYPLSYLHGQLAHDTNHIAEYHSPSFHQGDMLLALLAILGLMVALAASTRSPQVFELMAAVFATASFLRWQRMAAIFAVFVLWTLAEMVQARFQWHTQTEQSRGSPAMGLSIVAVTLLLVFAGLPFLRPASALVSQSCYPEGAVRFAKLNNIQGRLLNTYGYGGYLIWRYYGHRVVWIDGRQDIYSGKVFTDLVRLLDEEPGWQGVLNKYHFTWAMLDRESHLAHLVRLLPDWHVVYGDAKTIVLLRDVPANASLLARWRAGKLLRPHLSPLGDPPCGGKT